MIENPTNNWVCLASACSDLVIELPRQDFPDTGIAGVFSSDDENTTKSTTSASMFAECICKHLNDAQLAELLSLLELGVQR